MQRIEGLTIGLDLDTTSLNRGLTGLKDKLRNVNSEMKANMSAFDRGDRSVSKYETRLTGLNRKLEVQKEITKKAKEEYEKMVQEHGEGSKEADKAARAFNNEVAALNNLERYIERTREELEQLRAEQRLSESSWHRFGQRLEAVGNRLTKVGNGMKSLGQEMSMRLTAPIVGLGGGVVKTAADFEESMDKVSAISGSTGEDFNKLRDLAKKLGAETRFSASEAAEGMQFLAMAGFKTNDILAAMPGMLDLAAAGALELGDAADITSNIMSGFGIQAERSGHVSDVLAKAASNANTDVAQLGEAMKYLAAPANVLGWSVEESTAAVMAFGDAGIQGSMAGQAFASSLGRLAKPTKAMRKVIKATGISFFDMNGNIKPLPTVIGDLEKATSKMTAEQKSATLTTLFGAEAFKHWAVLLEKGSGPLAENTEMLIKADGAATAMAKTMSENTKGGFKTFLSALEGLAIQLGDVLLPIANDMITTLTKWTRKFSALSPETQKMILAAAGLTAALGPLLFIIGSLTTGLGAVLTAAGTVSGAIAVVTTGAAAATPAVGALASAFTVLTGPIGWTIAAITGLTVAGVALYKHLQKDAIPEVDRFGDSVSKSTKKALGGYFELSDGASQKLTELSLTQQKVTTKTKDALVETYSKMNAEILAKMEERHNKELEKSQEFFIKSNVLTQEQEEKILRERELRNQAEIAGQEYKELRIKEILEKAAKEKRSLTESEKKEINSLQEQMNENAVKYLSKNELEAKVIMERMKQTAGDLSAKQAAEVVKNSNKQKDEAVAAAEKQYDETLAEIIKMRDETGEVTAEQADRMIKEAERQKSVTVGRAEETHKEVVSTAKAQAGDHINTVNWETGEVLTKWESFKVKSSQKWDEIKTNASRKWSDLKKDVVNKANETKDNVLAGFENLRIKTKEKFDNTKQNISTLTSKAKNAAISNFDSLRTRASEIFSGISTKISGYVSNMVETVKGMPGRMGEGLRRTAYKIGEGLSAVANKMASSLGKGINGVIGGVNWVLGKVGVSNKIAQWPVPQYATGTDNHPGGPAVVGEEGRELAHVPGVGYTMLGEQGAQFLSLPKGTSVLPNKETENLLKGFFPGYAKGTGWLSNAWNNTKKAASNIKDKALDVWSYLSDPGKLFNKALETFGVETPNFPGILKGIDKGSFNKVKGALKDYLVKKIEGFGSSFGGNVSGNVKQWIMAAIAATGVPHSWAGPLATIAQKESGGNPKAINLWDINAKRGIPSKGLMQTIDPTFLAYRFPGMNDIWNPVHNAAAAIRYIKARYGNVFNVPGIKSMAQGGAYRGYATGGLINNPGLYNLAEDGWPEFVIPTDPKRRTDAMKLLALAGKQIQGNKRPNQLPSLNSGNDDNVLVKLLEATMEQTQVLLQLLNKDSDIYLEGSAVAKGIRKDVSKYQQRDKRIYSRNIKGRVR